MLSSAWCINVLTVPVVKQIFKKVAEEQILTNNIFWFIFNCAEHFLHILNTFYKIAPRFCGVQTGLGAGGLLPLVICPFHCGQKGVRGGAFVAFPSPLCVASIYMSYTRLQTEELGYSGL